VAYRHDIAYPHDALYSCRHYHEGGA
jgi:hypothetical protein